MNMASYYDYVLMAVPSTIVTGTFLLTILGIALQLALFASSAVTVCIIAHALFVRAPLPEQESTGNDVLQPPKQHP